MRKASILLTHQRINNRGNRVPPERPRLCRTSAADAGDHPAIRTGSEQKKKKNQSGLIKAGPGKNENTKGEGTVDHGNNNSVPSSGSAPVNSRFSSAAANLPALKPPVSNGKNSSGSAAGFEPGTCGAMDNKNYNINSAARSRENAENETENDENKTENDLVNCNWWARKCEECACTHDVEGNVGVLQGRCCSVHGKACQSFAEVKRSEDPYSDFRCSMVQMILENNIYQPSELKGLLECFLSLNSPRAPWDYREGFHGSLCQYFAYSVGRNLMDGLPLPSTAVIGLMYIVDHCVFGFVKEHQSQICITTLGRRRLVFRY